MRMLGYHWIFLLSRKDPIRTCIRARPALVASSHYMEVQHELESGKGSQGEGSCKHLHCNLHFATRSGRHMEVCTKAKVRKFHKYKFVDTQIQLHWCTNAIELVHKYNSIGAQIQLHWCTYTIELVHKYNSIGAQIQLHWSKNTIALVQICKCVQRWACAPAVAGKRQA